MLISISMQNIIRVMLNHKDKGFTVRELATSANVSLGQTVKTLNLLASTDYITKRPNIKLKNFTKLLNAWAYSINIKETHKAYFSAAERPEYLMKKIAQISSKNNLLYAFTLYCATEQVSPYVVPNSVEFYVLDSDIHKWEKCLTQNNIFLSEKGNVVLHIVDANYFYNVQKVNNYNIISLPQLYVDLFSIGGRGEEAAQQLIKMIERV